MVCLLAVDSETAILLWKTSMKRQNRPCRRSGISIVPEVNEFLLTLLHIFFLRFSCWPYFQHRWIAQTPVLWLDLLWLFLSLEVSREIFVDCWKVFPSHSQCPYEFVRITHFSVLICFCAGGLLSAYSSFRYFGTSASEMGSELNLMSLCRL